VRLIAACTILKTTLHHQVCPLLVATVSSHVMKYLKFSVLLKEIQPTSTNNILMEICDCFFYYLFVSVLSFVNQLLLCGGRCGCDHMIIGFTTTCVTSAYHHLCFLNLNPAHEDTTICDKFGLCHK
jgi:hypothetical protein